MKAFVFSGGGNRGAVEAGAAQELIASGILPDLLVGTSAGAINAAYLAAYGSNAVDQLAALWAGDAARHLLPFNPITVGARLMQGKSLFDQAPVREFLHAQLPPGLTFGQLQIPCYVVAADLGDGSLYLYGADKSTLLEDGVMASAAHPLMFEPIAYAGGLLVDGGIVSNAPLGVAIDMGATDIYLINAGYAGARIQVAPQLIPILFRSLDVALYQPLSRALKDAAEKHGITLHHLMLPSDKLQVWDMEHGQELVESGRVYARAFLSGQSLPRQSPETIDPPPGAILYTPPWERDL